MGFPNSVVRFRNKHKFPQPASAVALVPEQCRFDPFAGAPVSFT
ncbi:hypothetical protein CSE45_0948 [Citreicella sp. SE45]|nr:hypothetical protein CSE45_0948 [Citreicella sp. SE45]